MAQKKRKSKKQTSDTKITIIFVIVIIISVLALAGIWCYTHHPEVRAWLFQTFQRAEQFKEELASDGQQQEKVQHPSDDSLPAKDASDGGEDQSLLSTAVPPASDGLILLPSNLAFPRCPAVKHAPDHELRHFTDYDICYRESYEQAEWSAYQFLLIRKKLVVLRFHLAIQGHVVHVGSGAQEFCHLAYGLVNGSKAQICQNAF